MSRSGIITVEGNFFCYDTPSFNEYTIYSIAVALSNQCRYVGQLEEFYSVAQHCVMVSHIVPPEQALAGLLHDAAEAFIHDINRPLKARLPEYRDLEERIEEAIFTKFGVPARLTPEIHYADAVMLLTEKRDLRANHGGNVNSSIKPLPGTIIPLPPKAARDLFLARYIEITEDWKVA
jgi:5'-deoxynucleotidase YfbR-like HD superfamily hydrolase